MFLYYVAELFVTIVLSLILCISAVFIAGSTIYKSINRAVATTIAGSLGVGVHWVASHCDRVYQPIILGVSVFIFGELINPT